MELPTGMTSRPPAAPRPPGQDSVPPSRPPLVRSADGSSLCSVPDIVLASNVRLGDAQSMNEILRRHWSGVVNYVSRFAEHWDAAQDLAQDTFLQLWRGDVTWRETGSLRAFLYGVARNLARNQGRRWRQVRGLSLLAVERAPESVARTPAEELDTRELYRAVAEAIRALPPRRQEVFILARVHGLSHTEIGQALGVSTQTVANHMSSALAELRRRLREVLR